MHRRVIAIALAAVARAAQAQPAPAADPMPPGGADPDASAAPTDPSGTDRVPSAGPQPTCGDGLPCGEPPAPPTAPAPAPAPPQEPAAASEDVGDQLIAAHVGIAAGGRVTPGGLQISGHYLYQLAERDWFDGTASFVFGSGSAACFRDRQNAVVCDHGLADGDGLEITAAVRRVFEPQGAFRPFARVGLGFGLAQFGDDDVSGFTIRLHGGGGVRAAITPAIAVVADGDLVLGLGAFNRGLGSQPQLGLAISAGVEFRLR